MATATTFTVVGMTCAHCVRAVAEEVGKLEGVTGVDVDLVTGQVTVASEGPIVTSAFVGAVQEAGYEVDGS